MLDSGGVLKVSMGRRKLYCLCGISRLQWHMQDLTEKFERWISYTIYFEISPVAVCTLFSGLVSQQRKSQKFSSLHILQDCICFLYSSCICWAVFISGFIISLWMKHTLALGVSEESVLWFQQRWQLNF